MSAVAPTLEAFFTQRLMSQKRASRHTIAAYRDGFRPPARLRPGPQRKGPVAAGVRRP